MTYSAIVSIDGDSRVTKHQEGFATLAEAQAHVTAHSGLFAALTPTDGAPPHWLADTGAETVTHSPIVLSDAEKAAKITLAPATFFLALRAALPFATNGPAGPSATATTRGWLVAWLADLHAAIATAEGLSQTHALATALSTTNAGAQIAVELMINRLDTAVEVRGDDPALDALGAQMGLTPAQIDKTFIAAAGAADITNIPADVAAALS